METKEVLRLLLPLISIVMGIVIKYSDNPKFSSKNEINLIVVDYATVLISRLNIANKGKQSNL